MFPFRKKVNTKVDRHIAVANFCKELDAVISAARSCHVDSRIIAAQLETCAKAIRQRAAST